MIEVYNSMWTGEVKLSTWTEHKDITVKPDQILKLTNISAMVESGGVDNYLKMEIINGCSVGVLATGTLTDARDTLIVNNDIYLSAGMYIRGMVFASTAGKIISYLANGYYLDI